MAQQRTAGPSKGPEKRMAGGTMVAEETFGRPIIPTDAPKMAPVLEAKQPDPVPTQEEAAKAVAEAGEKLKTATGEEEISDAEFMKDYADISLDELIATGYVTHIAKIADRISVELRTLKKAENMQVDKNVITYEGSNLYVMNEASLDTLTFSVQKINGKPIGEKAEEKKKHLANLAEVIVQAVWEEFRKLNKATAILLKGSSKNSLTRRLVGPEQI